MRVVLRTVVVVATLWSAVASAQSVPDEQSALVVGTVGSVNITLGEVDSLGMQLPAARFGSLKLSQAIYEARRQALDQLVANMLVNNEAKAQGVERAALIEKNVTGKVTPPTDEEVTSWYLANQDRVQGAAFEQSRAPIRSLLLQERTDAARQAFLDHLKAKTPVKILLEPAREPVEAKGASIGPESAPVLLIEFSDFECPFCQKANPVVTELLKTYGDRIRLVYRHFPLDQHPHALAAAEAAACANQQGRFWPYHDRLFADPTKLMDADLKKTAQDLGLDMTRFTACVDSHEFRAAVEADIDAGAAAGVTGTPAFFINGRPVFGAPPIDAFKRIIDDELELTKRKANR